MKKLCRTRHASQNNTAYYRNTIGSQVVVGTSWPHLRSHEWVFYCLPQKGEHVRRAPLVLQEREMLVDTRTRSISSLSRRLYLGKVHLEELLDLSAILMVVGSDPMVLHPACRINDKCLGSSRKSQIID